MPSYSTLHEIKQHPQVDLRLKGRAITLKTSAGPVVYLSVQGLARRTCFSSGLTASVGLVWPRRCASRAPRTAFHPESTSATGLGMLRGLCRPEIALESSTGGLSQARDVGRVYARGSSQLETFKPLKTFKDRSQAPNIPPWMWYTVLSQLICRVFHPDLQRLRSRFR